MAGTPSRNSFTRLLESTASIGFQSATLPQIAKMLFTQTREVGRFLMADDVACESEPWLCAVQLIRKQSF
jgi:hypothetical protein